MTFKSIYPYTQETIAEYPAHTREEIEQKMKDGWKAFAALRQDSLQHRCELMLRAAALLKENVTEHATLISKEMGKTLKEAKSEVLKCAATAEYYAANIAPLLQPRLIASDAKKSYAAFEPKGIILAIMPWNFPFWQVFRFAAPSLMAGNTASSFRLRA